MDKYEINDSTVALIFNNFKTIVYEKDKIFLVNQLPNEIIKYSCEYFGSSYKGRVDGTKSLTGLTHKAPIIIEESNEIIFFPLSSPRLNTCSWLRNKYINNYYKDTNGCILKTVNGSEIKINCSYEIINNQILRSSRLESIIRYRKNTNLL
ncbi:MAG: competence protein ComK [Bacilli bacterium]|nr:competence protein ComK [Bacilli bacterium]